MAALAVLVSACALGGIAPVAFVQEALAHDVKMIVVPKERDVRNVLNRS